MNKDYFIELYDYTFWGDRKLFECVMALSDEQYAQNIEFSQGSIRDHIVHMIGVEHWWIHFLATGDLDFYDEPVYTLSREKLRDMRAQVERDIRAYLNTLTPQELERRVKPSFWDEEDAPVTVWQALLQVANHSTDHRAQTMAMLHTKFGAPTFTQDYLTYLDEKKAHK
jgi:uncharacterized damage-inducible protein DinB